MNGLGAVAALVGACALTVAGVATVLSPGGETVVVDRVVDGDTVDVFRDATTVRVRLLNIDTRESVDPNSPVECLGEDASAYLSGLLAPGTVVELEYDEERVDRYGRELAGLFVDGQLVNAEIARAGYGVPLLIEPNDRFYDAVNEAWTEAEVAGAGVFDPEQDCTFEGRVSRYEDRGAKLLAGPSAADSPDAALTELADEMNAVVREGDNLIDVLQVDGGSISAAGDSAAQLDSLRRVGPCRGRPG